MPCAFFAALNPVFGRFRANRQGCLTMVYRALGIAGDTPALPASIIKRSLSAPLEGAPSVGASVSGGRDLLQVEVFDGLVGGSALGGDLAAAFPALFFANRFRDSYAQADRRKPPRHSFRKSTSIQADSIAVAPSGGMPLSSPANTIVPPVISPKISTSHVVTSCRRPPAYRRAPPWDEARRLPRRLWERRSLSRPCPRETHPPKTCRRGRGF